MEVEAILVVVQVVLEEILVEGMEVAVVVEEMVVAVVEEVNMEIK